MLVEALKEILAEVRLEKEAQEGETNPQEEVQAQATAGPAESGDSGLNKISSEDAEYLKSKLSMLGLGKYAAYVDEINDVAGELVKSLLEELEKVATAEGNPFSVSDKPDLTSSAIDPITKFALS